MPLDQFIRQFSDPSLGDDTPLFEQREAMRGAPRKDDILFDQDHGDAVLPVQLHDHVLDLLDDVGLNAFSRLVQQEDLRLRQQRPRDGELLLLAAGQIAAMAMQEILKDRKQVDDPVFQPLRGTRREGAKLQVLAHREARQDAPALRHIGDARLGALVRAQAGNIGAVEHKTPGHPVHQAEDAAHQGGLADAVAAEHRQEFAGRDLQVDILQRAAVAVERVDVGQLKHW